jgi:Tol biopolymer transport system component
MALFRFFFFRLLTAFICLVTLSGCSDSTNSPDQGISEWLPDPPIDELAVWNPKSDWIAYEHTNKGWGDTDTSGVYLIHSDGSAKQLLVAWGQGPAWDSAGTVLAFTHYTGLWMYDFKSSEHTQLVARPNLYNPSFSFDGSMISFSDRGILNVYDIAGDSNFVLRDSVGIPISSYFPRWSPTARKLLIDCRSCQSGYDIWVYDYDTRGIDCVVEFGRYPRWSPDGNKISYYPEFGPATIIYDLSSRNSITVDSIYKIDIAPSDSQAVGTALVGDKADPLTLRYRLFTYNLNTRSLVQLTY